MDSVSQNKPIEPETRKPIGLNEGDFESVMVDGFLGFGVSAGCAIILLFFAVYGDFSGAGGSPSLVFSVVFIAALLFAGRLFSDILNSERGAFATLLAYALGFAAAIISLGSGLFIASAALSGLAFVGTVFLYGKLLGSLDRRVLAILLSAVFIFAGFTIVVLMPLESWYRLAPLSGATLLTILISTLFYRKIGQFDAFGDAAESKSRSIQVKGNNHTLLLLGFMLGAVVLVPGAGASEGLAVLSIGCSMGLAGILSLLAGQLDERMYKETMLKSCALFATACLVFLPLLPPGGKAAALSIYLCHVWLNVIVLVNAVVETSRFSQINPIWLIGYQGGVYFVGLLLGLVVFGSGAMLAPMLPHAPYASLMLGVVACSYMQISANYQAYPFEPVIETTPEAIAISQEITERNGQRKTLYQKKRQYACEMYSLSPREREILTTLLKGRDAKYIMDTFYISQSTAKTHIYNIYRKFDVHSRQELLDFIEDIELPPEELENVIPDDEDIF